MNGEERMELLEYFDENNTECIGTAEREEVHKKELWHREIAVWVMNERYEILLQRRSANKKQYPNKYAVCAGHIDLGEEPKVAAIRELEEETGLKVEEKDLIDIDVFVNKQKENNHFKYTYLIFTNREIEEMTMQEEEVSELKYITLTELENMILNEDESLTFSKKYYAKLILKFLKEAIKNSQEK